MIDIIKTQHFTDNYDLILKDINVEGNHFIDPFAGDCVLKNTKPKSSWEFYDIDPKNKDVVKNDSLLNPIDYTNKTVITNPPYLAKNKTKEFNDIFEKYDVDDLYKASILSLIGCKNGILIIPINFFTDEYSYKVRNIFLSQYKVSYVNVFTFKVFSNTTYNVCSFSFEKGETSNVVFRDMLTMNETNIYLSREFNYRIGGEFYDSLKKIKPVFSRITIEDRNKKIISTNIFLKATDEKNNPFNLSFKKELFYGKNTDRFFATLKSDVFITDEVQLELIERFNSYIKIIRERYGNVIFTNYRDNGRKRIGFDDVYKILTILYHEMM